MFGAAIAGLGAVHLFYPGFRPVFLPVAAAADFNAVPFIFGLSMVSAGLLVIFRRDKQVVAGLLAIEMTLFFLFGHLPNRLKYHPEILGVWTDAIKLLGLIGGALLITDQNANNIMPSVLSVKRKFALLGLYLFCIMLILFGIDHFLYRDLVSVLIPKWIQFKDFWVYFTGIALMNAGILIPLGLSTRNISLLLALMLFLWLIFLHLPAFFSGPDKNAVNIVSSLECLAFCGTALLLAQQKRR